MQRTRIDVPEGGKIWSTFRIVTKQHSNTELKNEQFHDHLHIGEQGVFYFS